jgi:succinate-semialdehyde dehydrogenase/glutarate-semialdehyde dehydrogenase
MRKLAVRNPRTGQMDAECLAFDTKDIGEVASRLRAGQRAWAALGITERANRLNLLADCLLASKPSLLASLETDTGRRRIAGIEIEGVAASLRAWAAQAEQLLPQAWTPGRSMPHLRHRPQFIPYPLVGVISPWNFPLTLSMIDTIPALLAGCSVIIKPSEVTPRFADPLRAAIDTAGLSDILGLATGDGATGAGVVETVDAICFTGSVATGRKVALAAAARLIPAFLELGGKDPLIILAGADIEQATDAALRGSVLSTGQACQSIERIYVARDIYDTFTNRLIEKARTVRLNWPDIATGDIGPIIFDRQAAILAEHIRDAVVCGAEVRTGGTIETLGGGLWLRPTVLTGVSHDMKVMTEETFGPILPVMPFDTVEEAIKLANDTEYGLSAAVFAATLEEAEAVAEQIEAGAVSLNDAALTGLFYEAEKHAFKASGIGGSRMGPAGLQRFLRRKALIANTGAPAPLKAFSEDMS